MQQPMSAYAEQQLALLNTENANSLLDVFDRSCQQYAQRAAFHCLGQTLTFAELERLSRLFAGYLLNEAGLVPGDRMAIQLPNCLQYPIVAWGAMRAGIVIVNTNPLYTARELRHQLEDSGAKAIVLLSDLLALHQELIASSGIECVMATHLLDLHPETPSWSPALPTAIPLSETLIDRDGSMPVAPALTMASLALLQYTGGTTGLAKGAALSHGNLFAAVRQSEANTLAGSNDLVVAPLPLYHIFGFAVYVLAACLQGGCSVLVPDPRNTDALVDTLGSYPFTGFAAVNTMFVALLNHPRFDSIDFSHLKTTIAGGTALVEEVARQWEARTGNVIQEGYGLSETSAVLCCNGTNGHQLGTVGRPVTAQEIRVLDDAGQTLPAGEPGELCVRGPQVMSGYWNKPDASAEVLDREGWFRTGDVAVIQDDGFVRIVDRKKDMILVSGFNVYPNEIEGVLYEHPDVLECAVVGVADAGSGESVKAFIVPRRDDVTEDELIAYCRTQLTAYKIPRCIEFRTELPKSNVGKILRRSLRD